VDRLNELDAAIRHRNAHCLISPRQSLGPATVPEADGRAATPKRDEKAAVALSRSRTATQRCVGHAWSGSPPSPLWSSLWATGLVEERSAPLAARATSATVAFLAAQLSIFSRSSWKE